MHSFQDATHLYDANDITASPALYSNLNSGPVDIITYSADIVYVANVTGNSVTKVTSAGVVTTIAAGIRPIAGAPDSSNNIYTVNQSYGDVIKITPSGQAYTFKLDGFAAGSNMFYKRSGTAGVSVSLYLWSVEPNQMVQFKGRLGLSTYCLVVSSVNTLKI